MDGDSGFGMFGNAFGIMGTIVPLFFIVVIGIIVFSAWKGVSQWNRNNQQPVLHVEARLVSKRTNVSHRHHHHGGDEMHHSSSTSTDYFVTFEVESGDRMEFRVSGTEYGMLAEGDFGKLSFQGTRYLGFQRAQRADMY